MTASMIATLALIRLNVPPVTLLQPIDSLMAVDVHQWQDTTMMAQAQLLSLAIVNAPLAQTLQVNA